MNENNSEYPLIYVLILNYNSPYDSIELFKQIQNQVYKNFDVFIMDNNSTDNSKKLLKNSIPKANLILNEVNLGYAGGNNIGIKKAIENGADFVWILNPDIRIEEDTLKIIITTISKNEKIAAVGPRICQRDNKKIIYSDGGIFRVAEGLKTGHLNSGKNINDVEEIISSRSVDYINGSCILIRVAAIKEIGYMREDFFLYFEETEWCYRARMKGKVLLTTNEAVVYHQESKKKSTYYFYMTRNRIYLSRILNKYIIKTVFSELMGIINQASKLYFYRAFIKSIGLAAGLFKKKVHQF